MKSMKIINNMKKIPQGRDGASDNVGDGKGAAKTHERRADAVYEPAYLPYSQKSTASMIIFAVGMLICTAVPAGITLAYFPLWRQNISASPVRLAGGALVMVGICVLIPLCRWILPKLKQPAPVVMWTVAWMIFYAVRDIIASLTVIAFWGMISSAVSAVLFGISAHLDRKYRR